MKSLIIKILAFFGFNLSKKNKRGWSPEYLRSLSDANVVLDIGAAYGTPKLYKAFEGRRFILFEPLTDYHNSLELWKKKINCEVVYSALGNENGEIQITVDPRRKTMSSLVQRADTTRAEGTPENRSVQISKLDAIIGNYLNEQDNIIMKIDVEGFELEVLKGSEQTLSRTDLVIVETSVAILYENQAGYLDIIAFMDNQGFRLFDILHLAYYRDWKGLMWMDLVFTPKNRAFNYSK